MQAGKGVPSDLLCHAAPQYNKLTVRCSGQPPPAQLQYLADGVHLCPQYPPAGALPPLAEASPVTGAGNATRTSDAVSGSSDSADPTINEGIVGEPLSPTG